MKKLLLIIGLISANSFASNQITVDCASYNCINSVGGVPYVNLDTTPPPTPSGSTTYFRTLEATFNPYNSELTIPRVCIVNGECLDWVTVNVTVNRVLKLNGVVVK